MDELLYRQDAGRVTAVNSQLEAGRVAAQLEAERAVALQRGRRAACASRLATGG